MAKGELILVGRSCQMVSTIISCSSLSGFSAFVKKQGGANKRGRRSACASPDRGLGACFMLPSQTMTAFISIQFNSIQFFISLFTKLKIHK